MSLQQRHSPSGTTTWLWLLMVAWVPAGFLFSANAEHFGWGFFPLILWSGSFPFVATICAVAAVSAWLNGGKVMKVAVFVWLVLMTIYVALSFDPRLSDWIITREPEMM